MVEVYVLGELSMLKRNDFERWIDATHTLFEIFEGRYDVYPSPKHTPINLT